jgi:alpha-L-fucosidase
MKHISHLLIALVLFTTPLFSQNINEFAIPSDKVDRMQWWSEARFGMFIHWGLYALPARHEWVMSNEQISKKDYEKYVAYFNPDLYNPKEWAKLAKDAGMKYVVFTAKHHDGFSMYDSKYSEFKVTNSPIGRDLLKELIDAFRAEDIRIGLYYSLIDWHHPDFLVNEHIHPERNNQEEIANDENRDKNKFQRFLMNQITELLTNYGQIDVLFADF